MIIRPSQPADRDAILAFIAEMGFNPRDAATWNGLNMRAMTAWDGATLVAAIPLEPRLLRTHNGTCVHAVHETVVATRPEYRGKGLGSALQQALLDAAPDAAQLATVFREDPASPAYRWYLTNGFTPVVHVDSWFNDNPRDTGASVESFPDGVPEKDGDIEWLRRNSSGQSGGLIDRQQRPLSRWLPVHPYRSRYQFHCVMTRTADRVVGFALLGVGTLHSQTTRADILDFCTLDSSTDLAQPLLDAVCSLAAQNGWTPVRWSLASSDPLTQLAIARAWESRWSFDMLARPLRPEAQPLLAPNAVARWRFAGIDYA